MSRRHPQRRAAGVPYSNPVARAIVKAEVRQRRIELAIHVLSLAEAEPCTEVLAECAWLVGLGCEVAHATQGASATARRLHGTLRGIVQLCVEGGRWKERLREPLDWAIAVAHDLVFTHQAIAADLMPGAHWLAQRIRTRKADGTELAGAEIYATTGTPTGTTHTTERTA